MSEIVIITLPNINNENFLSFTEDSSYFSMYVAGRFRVIDMIVGNFERAGLKNFLIISDMSIEEIEKFLIRWPKLYFVFLSRQNRKFNLKYSNISLSQYKIVASDNSQENILDLWNFLSNFSFAFWSNGLAIWFPLEDYLSKEKSKYISLFFSKYSGKQYYHTAYFSKRYFSEFLEIMELNDYNQFYIKYGFHNSTETEFFIFMPFTTLKEYFRMNLSILDHGLINKFESLFGRYPIRVNTGITKMAVIGKHGKFVNALIGDNTFVDSLVENSIICPGVEISRDSYIRNAIIYPGNKIGSKVEINNALIDAFYLTTKDYNIGNECLIGGKGLGAPSVKYPSILNFDAAVIGKNVIIPKKTQISLNAYIPSNTDISKLKIGKYIKSSTVF